MLKTALVEALARHVEVLHLELLDALTQDTIHFAHVDELVVDFVDAPCTILVALGSIPHCIRLLGLLRTLVMLCILVLQESPMLCVTHCDLRLHLLRKHALQMM